MRSKQQFAQISFPLSRKYSQEMPSIHCGVWVQVRELPLIT